MAQNIGAPVEDQDQEDGVGIEAPALETPDPLKKAAEVASANIGAPVDQAEQERIFKHRADPYFKAADKARKQSERYFQAQGLRYSSDRARNIGEQQEETWRQVGENVMVPQIERRREEERADIELGARVGEAYDRRGEERKTADVERAGMEAVHTGVYINPVTGERVDTIAGKEAEERIYVSGKEMTLRQLESAMDRAIAEGNLTGTYTDPETGLTYETLEAAGQSAEIGFQERHTVLAELGFEEEQTQFDAELKQRKTEFARSMKLSKAQFEEAQKQYKLGRKDELARLEKEWGLRANELEQAILEFGAEMDQRQTEWKDQIRLERKRFHEGVDQFDMNLRQRKREWRDEFGLSEAQFEEFKDQYDSGHQQRIDEWADSHGLDKRELRERMRQFDEEIDMRKKEMRTGIKQHAAELGLEQAKFEQMITQYNEGHTLEKRAHNQAVRQFNKEFDLREKVSKAEIKLNNNELKLRKQEIQDRFNLTTAEMESAEAMHKKGIKLEDRKLDQAFKEFKKELNFREAVSDREFQARRDEVDFKIDQWADQYSLNKKAFRQTMYEFNETQKTQKKQLKEQGRQFDEELEQVADQFIVSSGLSRDQFMQSVLEYNQGQDVRLSQITGKFQDVSYEQVEDEFGNVSWTRTEGEEVETEEVRRYNQEFQKQLDDFSKEINLRKRELNQQRNQFDDNFSQRKKEWRDQHGLAQDEFDEVERQFDKTMLDQSDRFSDQLDLSRDQFNETVRQQTTAQTLMMWDLTGETGRGGELTYEMVGLDISAYLDEDGNIKADGYDAYFKTMDQIGTMLAPFIGDRELTNEEVHTFVMGGSLPVENMPTLAAQSLYQEAGQFATEAGMSRERFLNEVYEFGQLETERSTQFSRQMDLSEDQFEEAKSQFDISQTFAGRELDSREAEQYREATRAFWEMTGQVGGPGVLGAADMGIGLGGVTNDDGSINQERYLAAQTQIRDLFGPMLDEDITNAQLHSLIMGGTIDVAVVPTVEARRATAQMQQFNDSLAFEDKQLEAQITRWNDEKTHRENELAEAQSQFTTESDLLRDEFTLAERQQDMREAEVQRQASKDIWELTGQVAGSGQMTAAEMGINLTGLINAETGHPDQERVDEITEQIKEQFGGLVEGDLTQDQIQSLMDGNPIEVNAMPTLAARQVNQRADEFAASMGLSRDQFDENVRQFNAGEVQLDEEQAESIRQFNSRLALDALTARHERRKDNKMTIVAEMNAAMDRAIAQGSITGEFVDPVTNLTYDTMQARVHALDERVQRAAMLGFWEESNVVIDINSLIDADDPEWEEVMRQLFPDGLPVSGDGEESAGGSNEEWEAAVAPLVETYSLINKADDVLPMHVSYFANWLAIGGDKAKAFLERITAPGYHQLTWGDLIDSMTDMPEEAANALLSTIFDSLVDQKYTFDSVIQWGPGAPSSDSITIATDPVVTSLDAVEDDDDSTNEVVTSLDDTNTYEPPEGVNWDEDYKQSIADKQGIASVEYQGPNAFLITYGNGTQGTLDHHPLESSGPGTTGDGGEGGGEGDYTYEPPEGVEWDADYKQSVADKQGIASVAVGTGGASYFVVTYGDGTIEESVFNPLESGPPEEGTATTTTEAGGAGNINNATTTTVGAETTVNYKSLGIDLPWFDEDGNPVRDPETGNDISMQLMFNQSDDQNWTNDVMAQLSEALGREATSEDLENFLNGLDVPISTAGAEGDGTATEGGGSAGTTVGAETADTNTYEPPEGVDWDADYKQSVADKQGIASVAVGTGGASYFVVTYGDGTIEESVFNPLESGPPEEGTTTNANGAEGDGTAAEGTVTWLAAGGVSGSSDGPPDFTALANVNDAITIHEGAGAKGWWNDHGNKRAYATMETPEGLIPLTGDVLPPDRYGQVSQVLFGGPYMRRGVPGDHQRGGIVAIYDRGDGMYMITFQDETSSFVEGNPLTQWIENVKAK